MVTNYKVSILNYDINDDTLPGNTNAFEMEANKIKKIAMRVEYIFEIFKDINKILLQDNQSVILLQLYFIIFDKILASQRNLSQFSSHGRYLSLNLKKKKSLKNLTFIIYIYSK